MSGPLVSFVVLNWHAEESTLRCVESIQAQQGDARTEIVVVDNESTLETRRRLAGGPFRIVALDRNRGFTGGMNAGAAVAEGDFIALLNNDLLLPPDWLAQGLRAMADEGVGIAGGPSDGEAPGVEPSGDDDAAPRYTASRIDPDGGFPQLLRDVKLPSGPVPTVNGSHLLIRREAWNALGGYDDDFFAYCDEDDLCARAWALGWQVLYEPELRVWHRRGLSSDRLPLRRAYWAKRNRLMFIAKHFPERDWRRMSRRAVRDYLSDALLGRSGGLRGWRRAAQLSATERTAGLFAALWWTTHRGRLRRKRREAIDAGQHDEAYRDRLLGLPLARVPDSSPAQ